MVKSTIIPKRVLFAAILGLACASGTAQVTFNYTGAVQTYTVPAGVSSIRLEAWGAQGQGGNGGLGGYAKGTMTVTPGQVLNIYVGGQAGYNGGGLGHAAVSRNGGGASDIRVSPYSLTDRVIVAGGGGAGGQTDVGIRNGGAGGGGTVGSNYAGGAGGDGYGGAGGAGGLNGGAGNTSCHSGGGGGGGLNSGGGASCNTCYGGTCGTAGTLGQGGAGDTWENGICYNTYGGTNGGGGGYYGGGGTSVGNCGGGGGGGGSSWVGTLTNTTLTGGIRTGDGQIVITVLNGITVTQSAQILCNGQATASLTATPFGGTAPYTYFWSPSGGTAATASGLAAGTYTVTVQDAALVVTTQTFTVTQPSAITASTMQTNVSCFGGSNGDAMVMVSGGTPSYGYSWAPSGGTGSMASSLTAGTYTCTIADANGCVTSQSFNITSPTQVVATATATPIACNGGSSTVTVTASGGTGSYTGSGAFTVTAGTHTYVVTDANGCSATASITITEPAALSATTTSVNVLCHGDANGSIDLTPTGGTLPYTYNWNSGQYTTEDLTGLTAGTYSGVMTDANGCTTSGTVTITEPATLAATVTNATNPTTCSGTNGAVNITISGGTMNYSFSWSNSATSEDITGVAAGSYSCTITDANGCTTTASATLVDPTPPVATLSLNVSNLCADDASITLTGGSPLGGVYSGTGVTAGVFDPSLSNVGANTITYTYTDGTTNCSGSATGVITVNTCTGIVNPDAAASNFSVMPNPNNGNFTVQLNTKDAADVLVYDALGQLVSQQKVQAGGKQEMNIKTQGVYMITVITADGQRSTQRVIVNK